MTEANKYPAHDQLQKDIAAIATGEFSKDGFIQSLGSEFQSLLSTQAALEAKVARLVEALTDIQETWRDSDSENELAFELAGIARKTLASLNSTNKGDK